MVTTSLEPKETLYEEFIEHLEKVGNSLPKEPNEKENTKSQFSDKDEIPRRKKLKRRSSNLTSEQRPQEVSHVASTGFRRVRIILSRRPTTPKTTTTRA